jgi:hypothetical protein
MVWEEVDLQDVLNGGDFCNVIIFFEVLISLSYRNRIVVYLSWVGWLEVYGIFVSVNVVFLYTAILQSLWIMLIVMSRKFIWLFSSHYAVNLSCGCTVLKSFTMF